MAMEPLDRVLDRTGNRASLVPEYVEGNAPANQHKQGHEMPEQPSYHGLPALRESGWKWHVPAYFFVGGVGVGAYIAAVLADIKGRKEDLPLVDAGYTIALISMILSPILLILDLGRPERWYNMLRVFRPRSMMNMGSYVLTLNGVLTGIGALAHLITRLAPGTLLSRLVGAPLKKLSWLGVVPSLLTGIYTGMLLAATNVPLWAGNRLLIGPLFISSAISTGLAALHLTAPLFGKVKKSTEKRVEKAETMMLATELALVGGSYLALGRMAKPLFTGPWGVAFQIGTVLLGMKVPLLLNLKGEKMGVHPKVAPVLTLFGGLIMRFAMVKAGDESAKDPYAYFEYTRAKHGD
jgi:formate-dependent nitrite reductase membrane component NrfD